jgi:membrane associated rhomboid family serine protease
MLPLFTNLKFKQFPYLTYGLIALNVAVFIAEMSLRDWGNFHDVVRHWTYTVGKAEIALVTGYPELVFHAIASVFVAMFLHVNIVHLVTNMTFFFALGPAMEAELGKAKFLCFYLASGICASLYYEMGGEPGAELLGASGALGGLIGAFLLLWPRARITCFMGVKVMTSNALVLLLDFAALQFAAYYFGVGQSVGVTMGVAYSAHIGGLLFGFSFAGYLRLRRTFSKSTRVGAVLMPSCQKELYDYVIDWLEAAVTKCWRTALWIVCLPVRKQISNL